MQNNQPFVITHDKSRTYVQVPVVADPNTLNTALSPLLSKEGYSLTSYTGAGVNEIVWKKGTGMASAMKYIKLEFRPNMLIISAWICPGMFSLTICELPLDGFYAAVPKKACMSTVQWLARTAQTIPPQPQPNTVPQPQQ